jgi:hypothetical protein
VKAIDDFEQEIQSQRQNKELMAFLDKRARQTEWIPLEQVEQRLGLPPWKGRKSNAKRSGHR